MDHRRTIYVAGFVGASISYIFNDLAFAGTFNSFRRFVFAIIFLGAVNGFEKFNGLAECLEN